MTSIRLMTIDGARNSQGEVQTQDKTYKALSKQYHRTAEIEPYGAPNRFILSRMGMDGLLEI